MRIVSAVSAVILVAAIGGCSNLSSTQQRTATGGLAGAAGGAVLGAIGGNAALGAAAGAGAGLLGGYLWDQHKKSEDQAYQQGYAAAGQQRTQTR
jgi:osmotically inducible lipoprotein OsmB